MERKICPTCKKNFSKNYFYSQNYWKRQRFCSIKCSRTTFEKGLIPWNKGKDGPIGENSPSYKGGRNITFNGYVRVLVPGTGSYQLEHRAVMEKHLGRKLDRREHVHHLNHNKLDNRIENLAVVDICEHNRLHTKGRWDDKEIPFRKNLKQAYE